jgi:uncharacterized protein YdhG (YjbR/CyaY superfamily)
MKVDANDIETYLQAIDPTKKEAYEKLHTVVLENIPEGFEETFIYGSIGYVVPKSTYPNGYHCDPKVPLPFVNIACQKNFIALYHMGIYANNDLLEWFTTEYPKHCKYKLDMGKSCIRFKKMDDIPYELIAELMGKMSMEQWIQIYESNLKK